MVKILRGNVEEQEKASQDISTIVSYGLLGYTRLQSADILALMRHWFP